MSSVPLPLPIQGGTPANSLSVEAMFAQILGAVQKSVRNQFCSTSGPLVRIVTASRDIRASPRVRKSESRQCKSRAPSERRLECTSMAGSIVIPPAERRASRPQTEVVVLPLLAP